MRPSYFVDNSSIIWLVERLTSPGWWEQEMLPDVLHALQVRPWHTKLSYLVGIGMRNALASA